MSDLLTKFLPIAKIDEEKRMVWGKASDETIDAEAEITDYEATKEAVAEWQQWSNIREMHGPSAIGVAQEIILDDATSAVDMDTEFKIQEALDASMRHCTTFIVAQRISSALNADQLFILDGGHIVAKGTHRELLTTSPIYLDIFRSQFGEESLANLPRDISQSLHADGRDQ